MAANPKAPGTRIWGKPTPEQDAHRLARQEKFLGALRSGATRSAAQHFAGVHDQVCRDWLEADPDFLQRTREAEAFAEITCSATVLKAAKDGDWRAAMAWLERRRKDDWRRSDEINVRDLTTEQILNLCAYLDAEEDRLLAQTPPDDGEGEGVRSGPRAALAAARRRPDALPPEPDEVLP